MTTDYAIQDWAQYHGSNCYVKYNSFLDNKVVLRLKSNHDNSSMDARYNWWNTTDEAVVAKRIVDGNTDYSISGLIEYLPILSKADSGTPSIPAENPFNDIESSQYYYNPVMWAVNHQPQITNGTSATTFSPEATCTRGQVVTFLWRAKGCPQPKSSANPFNDVAPGAYYYEAVLWANENGITNGTSANTFSPDQPCTRAQVVTFLWRTEGKPAAGGSGNPFSDVPAGQYYTTAVLWAVNHKPEAITNGTSANTFSPDATCTRGQIVTFLYRDMK